MEFTSAVSVSPPQEKELLFEFEKSIQRSLPSKLVGKTQSEFIYKFRYPIEYPILSAIIGYCYGQFKLQKDKLIKRPESFKRSFVLSKVKTFAITQLFYSALITGIQGWTGKDNLKSRFAAGIATSYFFYMFTGNYVKAWRIGPYLTVGSIAFRYAEQPVDLSARFRNYVEYDRKRMRAQQLLDPSRPDYEELYEYLEMKNK